MLSLSSDVRFTCSIFLGLRMFFYPLHAMSVYAQKQHQRDFSYLQSITVFWHERCKRFWSTFLIGMQNLSAKIDRSLVPGTAISSPLDACHRGVPPTLTIMLPQVRRRCSIYAWHAQNGIQVLICRTCSPRKKPVSKHTVTFETVRWNNSLKVYPEEKKTSNAVRIG